MPIADFSEIWYNSHVFIWKRRIRMVEQYSDSDFEALLEKYDYNFKRGDIVKGIVCA